MNEQVRFFQNKQGTGRTNWLTGTVSGILDCGHSYMITGPNGRVYRRNRAHLKPICYNTTLQSRTTATKDKQPKLDSFQDPRPPKKVKTVFLQTDTADIMARAMIFNELDKYSSHPPSHPSVTIALLTQITITLTLIIFSTQETFSGTKFRGIHTQRQQEMQIQACLHPTPRC